MARLAARTCETQKPMPERDRLLGDGDGLFLRVRPNGNKTWVIEYEFKGHRRKFSIGVHDRAGASGESITAWLEHGRLSDQEVQEIVATIRSGMLDQSWATRRQHVEALKERFSSTTSCPKCGGALVLRTARAGAHAGSQFYGCTKYPACRYTAKVDGALADGATEQ